VFVGSLVHLFVRGARCNFSQIENPIFMMFGTYVQNLYQLFFTINFLEVKVKTAVLKNLPLIIARP